MVGQALPVAEAISRPGSTSTGTAHVEGAGPDVASRSRRRVRRPALARTATCSSVARRPPSVAPTASSRPVIPVEGARGRSRDRDPSGRAAGARRYRRPRPPPPTESGGRPLTTRSALVADERRYSGRASPSRRGGARRRGRRPDRGTPVACPGPTPGERACRGPGMMVAGSHRRRGIGRGSSRPRSRGPEAVA